MRVVDPPACYTCDRVVSRSVSSNTRSLSRHVVALHCTRSSWYAVQVSTLGPTPPLLRRAPSYSAVASPTGRTATASWSRAIFTPKVSSKLFSAGSLRRRPARPHLHLHPSSGQARSSPSSTHRRPCQEYLEDLDILHLPRPRQEYLEDLDILHSRSLCSVAVYECGAAWVCIPPVSSGCSSL